MPISIFDITGPVTVGPSSSHTAGAVRIGNAARIAAGAPLQQVSITFYGSFASTYRGHGTDLAVVGGLLGLSMNNPDIRRSFSLAHDAGMEYSIHTESDPRYHPNTVRIDGTSALRPVNLRASSVGGGAIRLDCMNGYLMDVSCSLPTIIVPHDDRPGMIAAVSDTLARAGYNIASMKLSRSRRGGSAVVVIETDTEADTDTLSAIRTYPGVTDIISMPKV